MHQEIFQFFFLLFNKRFNPIFLIYAIIEHFSYAVNKSVNFTKAQNVTIYGVTIYRSIYSRIHKF